MTGSLPPETMSPLLESADAFFATTILEEREGTIRTVTRTWRKPPLSRWWAGNRHRYSVSEPPEERAFSLPAIPGSGCTVGQWTPSYATTPPQGRHWHSAVWTGAEMVIWGGSNGSTDLNTGGRYTPATDSWATTSTGTNVPDPRRFHVAFWTGTEMLVWGGVSGTATRAFPIVGGLYDPLLDASRPTSAVASPPGRSAFAAVWTGRKMLVWGGDGDDFLTLNTGGQYDPQTDTWAPTSATETVPTAVRGCSSIWTGAELILWGGNSFSSESLIPATGTTLSSTAGLFSRPRPTLLRLVAATLRSGPGAR